MMTGGVSRNRGVVAAIEERLGQPLFIHPDAQLCGALGAALSFAGAAAGLTALSLRFDPAYYGFGFLAGAAVLFLTALLRLDRFTRNLPYRILGQQPVVAEEKAGAFTRLGLFLERHSLQKKEEA